MIDIFLGMIVAWVLVRYDFPFKRIFDSLIDLPFALPTAVAGLVYSNLYVKQGWLGQFLVPLGIEAAYTRLAVVLVLTFIGLPFVVRTVQPVLESLDADMEEAAFLLGASRWQTFLRVILPPLVPAIVTGFALSLARALGEYGSVVFVSGNMPFRTEIAPVLIVSRLEEFAYAEATAIAVVLLGISFSMLVIINLLERWASHLCKADLPRATAEHSAPAGRQDPAWVRIGLTLAAVGIVGLLIVIPVVHVFYQALAGGPAAYWNNLFGDRDTRAAVLLTLTVVPVAVVANVVFGIAAAWCIARFRFPGRTILLSLIDVPFSVSPVVAGLMLVLIFGLQGYLGPWLREHDIKIIFAKPGLILATMFVTMPFVARELIPVMEAIGSDEEVAAVSLGASGWQMFWRVTVPNIKWGLLYGIILCNARAMGEFGAVYVVSGHIAGRTDTMPLRVEKLFQEYNNPGSFAVASVLTLLALVTLVVKVVLERKTRHELAAVAAIHNAEAEGT